MPPKFDIKGDFKVVFADSPDAAKLLKQVLGKESIRAIERDRGVEYTGGGATKSYSSGSDYEDGGAGLDRQRQEHQCLTSSKSIDYEPSQTSHRRLIVKKDGSHQRYICLALRFLLKQIPRLMSEPFVVSRGIHSREWVGAFSPLKNGSCMERLVQDLAVAEPRLGNLSALSLYKFYSNFVSKGEVLLEILEKEEEEEGEEALTIGVDGDDDDKTLRQERQSGKTFRRTFVSEAAMQLARLDREYRRRLGREGGSRKRKADLSFADETGVGSALEVDWEEAVEDVQEDEETLEEDNFYRTRKRVAAACSPTLQPAVAETPSSLSTSSSSSSTPTFPSIILQQKAELHQRHQRKYIESECIDLDRGCSAATLDAGLEPSIAFSREAYNDDKAIADQLSRTLENTEREQSHLSKALANLQEMLAQSRQQQRARFFLPNAHSAPDSHLDQSGVDTKARTTTATTILTTADPIQQPQQQPNLSHFDQSSASTFPSTFTNTPALTVNNSSATFSNVNTLATANTSRTTNYTPVSNSLLEEAIRSFGQDLKVQITGLKNAFENQQLQMIHLQEAVETQQTQLTAIQDTLNILVRQCAPSNIHNHSEKGKEIIGMSPISDDLAVTNTAPAVQAVPIPSPPAVQTTLIVPALPAAPTAATAPAKSPEAERTQPGTAPTQVRRRIRQRYKLSTPAAPAYVPTIQQRYSRSLDYVDNKTEDAISALGAGTVAPTTEAVALALTEAGARSSAATTATSVISVRPNLYRSTSQPSRSPPESLGADSLAKSTWNLDMLVISELAAAAVVDLDRQLTAEQQLQQLQSPLSPISTSIGAGVDMEVEPSTIHSPTRSSPS